MMRVAGCGQSLEWRGCYSGQQYDLWTAESCSHPAKMAPGLAFRILQHLEELGLLQPGQVVLDPLCGIGTSLLAAAIRGYRAVGVELEEKFVSMARENAERIALKGFGAPIEVLQGDARHLSELLAEKGMVSLTSPPYANQMVKDGQRLASNPSIHWREWERGRKYNEDNSNNIGNLPDAPITVTSPPYSHTDSGAGGIDWEKAGRPDRLAPSEKRRSIESGAGEWRYGTTEGQIGVLPDTVAVTSPPYLDIVPGSGEEGWLKAKGLHGYSGKPKSTRGGDRTSAKAVKARLERQKQGNIGHIGASFKGEPQPTYLDAMRLVYAEIAKVSPVLVVVVKDPTRNGKLRLLGEDTFWLLKTCHYLLYCVCGTHQKGAEYGRDRVHLSEREKSILALVQERQDMPRLRRTDKQSSNKVLAAQNQTIPAGAALRGDQGQDTSQACSSDLQRRNKNKAPSTSGQVSEKGTEAVSLPPLWEGGLERDTSLPSLLSEVSRTFPSPEPENIGGREKGMGGRQAERAASAEVERLQESLLEGRRNSLPSTGEQPHLAEAENAFPGERQFSLPALRQGRFNSSSSEQLGTHGESRGHKLSDNTLSSLPLQSGCSTETCLVCGKLKIPEGQDIHRLGFTIWDYHQAILFEEQEQGHLFDGSVKQPKGRLGFFKRLAYRKGSQVANFEHVLIGVREGSGMAAITSPPYGDMSSNTKDSPATKFQVAHYGESRKYRIGPNNSKLKQGDYGSTPGQIGQLKDK